MLLIVALTWCMMGTVEGAAEEAGREGKSMESSRIDGPREGENLLGMWSILNLPSLQWFAPWDKLPH